VKDAQIMLGGSSNLFDASIARLMLAINPQTVLDVGAGQGKIGIIGSNVIPSARFTALQRLFSVNDRDALERANYSRVIDEEIVAFISQGFDDHYSLATICDVVEHFMYSDAISVLKFLAYRCDWILVVWPSKHPQSASTTPFDRHRFSMSPFELFHHFDVVRYEQTGFAQVPFVHSYHLALIRGDMNISNAPVF
jgi:hypothetical protein